MQAPQWPGAAAPAFADASRGSPPRCASRLCTSAAPCSPAALAVQAASSIGPLPWPPGPDRFSWLSELRASSPCIVPLVAAAAQDWRRGGGWALTCADLVRPAPSRPRSGAICCSPHRPIPCMHVPVLEQGVCSDVMEQGISAASSKGGGRDHWKKTSGGGGAPRNRRARAARNNRRHRRGHAAFLKCSAACRRGPRSPSARSRTEAD